MTQNPDHGKEKSMLHKSYKKLSLNSKVELLKAGILHIIVNNTNNIYIYIYIYIAGYLNKKDIEDQFVNIVRSHESNEPNTDSISGRKVA